MSFYDCPIPDYGSSILSPYCKYIIDKVKKVQKFFIRTLTGIQNSYIAIGNTLKLQSQLLLAGCVLCCTLLHTNFGSSITATWKLYENIER